MIRFIVIVSMFFLYTCYKAVQLIPDQPEIMVFAAALIFICIAASMIISRTRPHVFERAWFKVLVWVGSLFIGFWGTFMIISLPIDLVAWGYALIVRGPSFLNSTWTTTIFSIAILMTTFGFISVLLGPKIVEVAIPSADLPEALKDLKIVQISDLHIGTTIQTRYVQRVVEKANSLVPDLIVITGDLVDAHTESIRQHLQPLANLKAKYGVFYVTGNHEYYWGIQSLLSELEKVGLTVLLNSNRVINVGSAKLLVAGIPDPAGSHFHQSHRPHITQARATREKTDFNILLSHRPNHYKDAEDLGFHLQFAGHTHAGQFFPFSLFIPLAHKYYRGLNRYAKLWLYVNSGTGYWGPANRFGIASEITLARLVRAELIES